MKKNLVIYSAFILVACQGKEPLIGTAFPDSLSSLYSAGPLLASNDREIRFWKNRMDTSRPGEVNEVRYAGALVTRFRYTGAAADVVKAEDILNGIDSEYRHKLSGPLLQLAGSAMLRHRFTAADTLLERARKLGIEEYVEHNVSFDVLFELGWYAEAAMHLQELRSYQDYNYFFRKARYEHLRGNTDDALAAIRQAVALANRPGLKGLALGSEGDLLMHTGRFADATAALKTALRLNPADLHTLLGIGWIALIHDKDTSLAGSIFRVAGKRNALPDPLFKLYQLGQWRGDTAEERYYGRRFAERAQRPEYGGMYNKYLIELYCGILGSPGKAEMIAREELKNRATPQTFAWYAYALLCNRKQEAAYRVFEKSVSGKPLEGVELYYCGKVLKAAGKGYDATAYFNAALETRADLSPAMLEEIEKSGD